MTQPDDQNVTDTGRGAAEEGSGTPVTPAEEAASRRPPSEAGDQDETPGGGTARPEDLSPDDFE